jgi:hypothetical protein
MPGLRKFEATRTTHLGQLVAAESQREASTVVVQVPSAWEAGGIGWQGFFCPTLPPGLTGRLQALARRLLLALLSRWALGIQGIRLAR